MFGSVCVGLILRLLLLLLIYKLIGSRKQVIISVVSVHTDDIDQLRWLLLILMLTLQCRPRLVRLSKQVECIDWLANIRNEKASLLDGIKLVIDVEPHFVIVKQGLV